MQARQRQNRRGQWIVRGPRCLVHQLHVLIIVEQHWHNPREVRQISLESIARPEQEKGRRVRVVLFIILLLCCFFFFMHSGRRMSSSISSEPFRLAISFPKPSVSLAPTLLLVEN